MRERVREREGYKNMPQLDRAKLLQERGRQRRQ